MMQLLPRISSLSIGFLCLATTCIAQHTISGRVVDATNGEALPFVNIVFNGDGSRGVSSDIDGFFDYESDEPIANVACSYVGYDNYISSFEEGQSMVNLTIRLAPSAIGLAEVVVVAGENPAHRIINAAVDNKSQNNPGNLPSFAYHAYNKSVFSIVAKDDRPAGLDLGFIKTSDSLNNLMISEAVVVRQFKAPNLNKETVIGNRISGIKHPIFTMLPAGLEPFSFYRDIIDFGDAEYVNPISKGSTSKYFFDIQDTLYQGEDSVFIIAFRPAKGTHFNALSGLLYINTNGFAIQNVIAEPADEGFLHFSLQQTYSYVDGKHWFPVEFNYEVLQSFKIDSVPKAFKLKNRYSLSDIEFDLDLGPKDFEEIEMILDDSASYRGEQFWDQYRPERLSQEEKHTYHVIDSLGEELNIDNIIFALNKLLFDGLFPVGPIDIDVTRFFAFNDYERFRLGLGLSTNQRLNPNWSIGGFAGYGFGDQRWKYGGEVTYRGDKVRDLEFSFGYQNKFRGIGRSILSDFDKGIDWAGIVASRFDLINQYYADFSYRPLRYTQIKASINTTDFTPLQELGVSDATPDLRTPYKNTEVSVGIRFAYKEKLIQSLDRIIAIDTRYPVLTIGFARGIDGVLGGEKNYNKIEARIDQTIFWKYMGKTRVRLAGGFVDQSVPAGLMYSGEGSRLSFLPFLVPNSFQTSEPYEFLSDQYFSVFFKHDFGDLLFNIGKFKPHIALMHNMGWGNIKHQSDIVVTEDFKTKEEGFFESGIQLDNIVRFNVLNMGYVGFGCAGFYRYGPYALDKDSDNIVIKFSMDWTSR